MNLTRFGPYEDLVPLGRGAMSSVFKARDSHMNRSVALKILSEDLTYDPSFVKRFQRELQAAGAIQHPNLVLAYCGGEIDGRLYIVMELVEGQTLRDRMKSKGILPESEALSLVREIALGLGNAHRNGLIHRDVKPANILIGTDGAIKLADLTLSKFINQDDGLTAAGYTLGTPYYMSPELALGDKKKIDGRSDIYALGATLFQCVTASYPFHHQDGMKVMYMHIQDPLPDPRSRNPNLSIKTSELIKRMMAKDPAHRFKDCAALVAGIDEILNEPVAQEATRPPVAREATRPPASGEAKRPPVSHQSMPTGIQMAERELQSESGAAKKRKNRRAPLEKGSDVTALLWLLPAIVVLIILAWSFWY